MSEQENKAKDTFKRSNNYVQLTGNLGADPELKTLDTGKRIAIFSMCTHDKFTPEGSIKEIESKEWHRVVAWNDLADLISEKLTIGLFVEVTGKIKTRQFEVDGQKRYSVEIVARKIRSLRKENLFDLTKEGLVVPKEKTSSEEGEDSPAE